MTKVEVEVYKFTGDLDYLYGLMDHLSNVYNTEEIRAKIESFEPKLIEF